MKADLDHLPPANQQELARVQRILLAEFEAAISTATKPHKRKGKVYKIILFGSYARDDWVDEPENGYQSDYDLLVVVSHRDLTEIADYWYVAEDKILRDPAIARPVNIIVHSLDEVNQALQRGEYFWVDIARDGIALYELPCHALATPMPLTLADAYQMAQEYFDKWSPSMGEWLEMAEAAIARGQSGGWPANAAFLLHQVAERAYACFLLVETLYFPRSHNIKFLRSPSRGQGATTDHCMAARDQGRSSPVRAAQAGLRRGALFAELRDRRGRSRCAGEVGDRSAGHRRDARARAARRIASGSRRRGVRHEAASGALTAIDRSGDETGRHIISDYPANPVCFDCLNLKPVVPPKTIAP